MGNDYSDLYPSQQLSQRTQQHLLKRFIICPHPVYSNSQHFKLLHEKLTNNKYILRILATNDDSQRQKLEDLIYKKIANKCPHLAKLEHYIFEDQKSYCGKRSKCYLVFEINQSTTLRQQILKQTKAKSFTQKQIINGMQNLLNGLLWLKYLGIPHGNINTYNIYCRANKEMILSDPWIAPQSSESIQRYPSPQKLLKICNKIEEYDAYVSDVFSVAMCMLEIIRQGKIDRIYKKNHTINYQQLIEQISKCPYNQLRQLLEYLLLGDVANRKNYLQEISRKIGNHILHSSNSGSQKSNKIKPLGLGIKRMLAKQGNLAQNKIVPNFRKNNNKFELLNNNDPMQLTAKPTVDVTMINQINSDGNSSKNIKQYSVSQVSKQILRIPSQKSINILNNNNINVKFKYAPNQNNIYPTQDKFVPFRTVPMPIIQPPSFQYSPYDNTVNDLKRQIIHLSSTPSLNNSNSLFYYNAELQNNSQFKKLEGNNAEPFRLKIQPNYFANKYHINLSRQNQQNFYPRNPFDNQHQNNVQIDNQRIQEYQKNQNNLKKVQKQNQSSKTQNLKQKKQSSPQIFKFIEKIDENIHVFQIAVAQAINNNAVNSDKSNVGSLRTSENVSQSKHKQNEERFTQFRPSQIMTSNLDSENSNKQNIKKQSTSDQQNDLKNEVISQLVNHEDIELSRSHNNQDGQNLKKSELLLKDSLVEEMKNINLEKSDQQQSKVQYNINKPFLLQEQDGGTVINSINRPQQTIQNNQEEVQMPGTPYKMRGTQLQVLNNLTIPEQAPSDQQSFEGQKKSVKGQFCDQIYQNGGKYSGYIYNGKRNGQGTFYYKDGGYYQGNWKDNMMSGEGKLYYEGGELAYDGQWYKDEFHGRGKVYNDSYQELNQGFDYKTFFQHQRYWKYYDGDLSHDMKEGHGKLMLSNGQYYIGQFKEDRPHGKGTYYAKAQTIRGIWSYGKLTKQI